MHIYNTFNGNECMNLYAKFGHRDPALCGYIKFKQKRNAFSRIVSVDMFKYIFSILYEFSEIHIHSE